jgi:aspartyl protease family protein
LNRARLFWIVLAVIGGGLILLIVNDSGGSTLGMPNGSFANLVYLGVWGTVLAAGIVASGRRLGDTARAFAVWMLIILVFVAVYQYRYELQDFASRVTVGLVPGSPLTINDGGNTVMLEKLGNGHFGARGRVNGATVDFIVDTGASASVLTASDAAAAGFDPASLSYNVPISTANGMARAALTVADSVSVGTIERRRQQVFIADRGTLDQSLLGMNFIGSLSGFDVRGDRMILRD